MEFKKDLVNLNTEECCLDIINIEVGEFPEDFGAEVEVNPDDQSVYNICHNTPSSVA